MASTKSATATRVVSKRAGVSVRSVYDDSGYEKEVFCIYFYYLTFPAQDMPKVAVYYHFDPHKPITTLSELRRLVGELAANARKGDYAPPPCGTNFGQVPHRRKSYFVILVDDDDLRLKKKSAIAFYLRGKAYDHTFFDAIDLEVNLSETRGKKRIVTAVACINHMQSKVYGGDLGEDEEEKFTFSLCFNRKRKFRPDDSGGTNQGQPIPPPYR